MLNNRSEYLNRRIVVERATAAPNAFNEPVLTWATYATLWAGRRDVSDGEKFAAGQVGSHLMSRFVVRSSPQSRGITPADRLSDDGAIWNILGVKETPDGRNRFLEITAVRNTDVPFSQPEAP